MEDRIINRDINKMDKEDFNRGCKDNKDKDNRQKVNKEDIKTTIINNKEEDLINNNKDHHMTGIKTDMKEEDSTIIIKDKVDSKEEDIEVQITLTIIMEETQINLNKL